jgi:hypothetical protein
MVPVGLLGVATGPIVKAEEPPLALAAKIPLVGDKLAAATSNLVMLDAGARRLIYWPPQIAEIRSYDLDTFQEVAHVATQPSQADYPFALDPKKHVLYHFGGGLITGYDTTSLKSVVSFSPPPGTSSSGAGLLWSDRDQVLYLIHNVTEGMGVEIDTYDPTGSLLWLAHLPGCSSTSYFYAQAALGETRDGRYLYSVCVIHGQGAGVVRMALPASPHAAMPGLEWTGGSPDLFPGLVTAGRSNSLWVPGQDRMVSIVSSNGGTGWSAYVFDAASLRFVAAPGLFNPSSDGNLTYPDGPAIGVDPVSGRFFAHDHAVSVDGRDPVTHAPCEKNVADTNVMTVTETAIPGASVLHIPTGDGTINGQGRFAGYDPVRHNWWMFSNHLPEVSACNPYGSPDAAYLVVWHDNIAPATAPALSNPDSATEDLVEQQGVTGANASSDASAYGVRYVLGPSGADGLMTNINAPVVGSCDLNSYVAKSTATMNLPLTVTAPPLSPQYHAFCTAGGRTATFAHVDKVSIDSSEVRADAITGDTDRETARDLSVGTDYSQPGTYMNSVAGYVNTQSPGPQLTQPCSPSSPPPDGSPYPPTSCDQTLAPVAPYIGGLALPYEPAGCGDNGTNPATVSSSAPLQARGLPQNNVLKAPGSAAVFCSYGLMKAQGHADQESSSVGGPLADPVSATGETADASVLRTSADGSVANATASVHDISVGSFLHIAKLTSTALVKAHGRPGTNPIQYECAVAGVSVTLPPGLTLPPAVPTSISTASCQDPSLASLVAALNTMFTGTLHIEFPTPYTSSANPPGGPGGVVLRQSPKGYLAQVALSDEEQTQNAILTNDTNIEQPGMVVTYYLDNAYSRNHLVASFAGVAASARYGIFNLDDATGDSGSGGFGSVNSDDSSPVTGSLPLVDAGQAPTVPPAPAVSTPPSVRTSGLGAVPQAIIDGFRFLFQHPQFIPPVLAVWILLVSPGYLLSRRRALLMATEGAV